MGGKWRVALAATEKDKKKADTARSSLHFYADFSQKSAWRFASHQRAGGGMLLTRMKSRVACQRKEFCNYLTK